MDDLTREVLDACAALGFARAGVCTAAPASRPEAFRRWLADGLAGTMGWMHEQTEVRLDVARLAGPDPSRRARSVIVVADRYAAPGAEDDPPGPERGPTGRIARYARGRDYHDVVRRRLHTLADALRRTRPGEEFRSFVDTGPVLEREHAARAGLGFIGKHTLLIDPGRGETGGGSYLLLGGIATTLALTPTAEPHDAETSRCGSCTRCIDACPTGAIEPFRVDARRCISYLTIEHEGSIAPELQARMGDWLFGCDICQEVCPYNRPAGGTSRERGAAGAKVHPLYREREGLRGGRMAVREVLNWTPEERRVALTVSAGKRATLGMMRRNAVIALANQPALDPESLHTLRRLADDDADPLVQQTARESLERLALEGGG